MEWIIYSIFFRECMPSSHIQRSPAEFVDRQKVAEFCQGVERIFRLKSTLSHFGRGKGAAVPFEH